MKALLVLLALPLLITAKINVDIVASDDKTQREVQVSGQIVDIISDEERRTFNLSDDALKNAVAAFYGAKPDDVYLKSPTPWNDLYNKFGWPQVSRVLKPLSAKVLSVSTQEKMILTQSFTNNSTKTAKYQATVHQDVENTVESYWYKSGEITARQDIEYGFDIKAMAVSGQATFSYISTWGENVLKSQKVTVGSITSVEISLEPQQSVKVLLNATRESMKVEVDYEASLIGCTAVNYDKLYRNHHFFHFDINDVMNATGMPISVLSSEVIDVGYYLDSSVTIHDSDTNEVLSRVIPEVYVVNTLPGVL